MAQVDATGLQSPNGDLRPSTSLTELLGRLSPAQAVAVGRIVSAELAGQSVESLLSGVHKICSRSTYYRKRGWIRKPEFIAALEQARREMRDQNLSSLVNDAVAELKAATPLAARDLRRQIVGDEAAIDALLTIIEDRQKQSKAALEERLAAVTALAAIGTPRATEALLKLLEEKNAEVRTRVIEMLGVSAAGVNVQRRLADIAVLDRADKMTASKSVAQEDLNAEIEKEIARLRGEAGDKGTGGQGDKVIG